MHHADPNESHHHLIEHPNEVPELDDTVIVKNQEPNAKDFYQWKNSAFVNWYLAFDKSTLRPLFVRSKEQLTNKDDIDDQFSRMSTFKLS